MNHASAIRDSLKKALQKQTRAKLGFRMFWFFFERYPETEKIFAHSDLESFASLKFKYVSEFILDAVQNPEYALGTMASEIYRHDYLDVRDQAYFNGMIDACQQAVQESLGEEWTEALQALWNESATSAKATVQEARKKLKSS